MKIGRLRRLQILISLEIILILLFCIGCQRPHIQVDFSFDEEGNVVLTGYYDRIEKKYKRGKYLLLSIGAGEYWFVHDRKYTFSENTLSDKILLNERTILPSSITYGQSFSKLKEKIKAKPLKYNIPYFIIIGVLGMDDDMSNRKFIVVSGAFMLVKDESGATVLKKQVGADEWEEVDRFVKARSSQGMEPTKKADEKIK